MVPKKNSGRNKKDTNALRRLAEKSLSEREKKTATPPTVEADTLRLTHELQVHQIELEMQKEELEQARAELEAALSKYTDLYDFAPVGYFTLARDGAIYQANLAGANLLGVAHGDLIERRMNVFISVESLPVFSAFLDKVFSMSRSKEHCEVLIQRGGSTPFWAHIEASPYDEQRETCHAVVVDITERVQAEIEVHQRAGELEMLYDSGMALNQLVSPKEIGQIIINLLNKRIEGHHTAIRLFDPETDTLELLVFNQPGLNLSKEKQSEIEERYNRISSSRDGLSGWAIQNSQIVRSGDVSTDPHYTETDPGMHSGLYVPLTTGQRMIGVISIESEQPDAFSEKDEYFIATLANQAASALESAQLFEVTRQRLKDLEILNRVSIALRAVSKEDELLAIVLEETLSRLKAAHGSINLLNTDTGKLHKAIARGWLSEFTEAPIQPGEGIFGTVFGSGEAYFSNDFSTDPLTLPEARHQLPSGWGGICMPLRSPDQSLGVLVVAVPSERGFSEDELRLLNTLAEMTGSALQRMQSDRETIRRLDQLQALHKIDQAITSSFDLKMILSLLLSHTVTQLGIDAAEILLFDPNLQTLEYAVGQGFRTNIAKSASIRLGDEFAGRVALERRTLSVAIQEIDSQTAGLKTLLSSEGFVAYFGVPLISKGELKGVLEIFHRTPLPAQPDWMEFLETLARQAAIAIDAVQLFENLQRSNVELSLAYEATIEGWSRAMDLRDKETEDHTKRVTEMTRKMAEIMGIGTEQIAHMRYGALLHDIGKLGVPDHVLLKPGKLTEDEWDLMRQHPQHSYDLLKPIGYLAPALDIPYCHHEKWDGTGYPNGLKGEQIPLAARIFAVVDVWDALISPRPYRPAWSEEKALEYIKASSGTHFDPKSVEAFLLLLDEREKDFKR